MYFMCNLYTIYVIYIYSIYKIYIVKLEEISMKHVLYAK